MNALPLVAVISSAPLLSEAVGSACEGVATVRHFPAGIGGTEGLLSSLAPAAIVVDSEREAAAATGFARSANTPLVHVLLRDGRLRVLEGDEWRETDARTASPEAIRNIVLGGIFGLKAAS